MIIAFLHIDEIMKSEHFDPLNPNKLRAVLGTFARSNPIHFHATDGAKVMFFDSNWLLNL